MHPLTSPSMTSPFVLSSLGFLAAVALVAGVASILSDLLLADRSRVSRRVDDEFRRRRPGRARSSPLFKDLGRLAAEAAADDDAAPGLRRRFAAMVEQSGLDLTPERLLAAAAAAGLALGLGVGLLRRDPLAGAVAAPLGALAPLLYAHGKRKARREALLKQLPDALDLMSRVVRAGQTMAQSLQSVADEFQPPIAAEFAHCYEQQNLGLAPELALRDLGRRTGLLEMKIFVLALMVQQQTGGNLAELLDKLAAVVRDRFRIRGVIRTLTAENRIQGLILLLLPPALFVAMLTLNHDFAVVLFDYPKFLAGTLGWMGLGALWIRRIVDFDF
jgi:tight adherence protein B